jgi:hypothetical protein
MESNEEIVRTAEEILKLIFDKGCNGNTCIMILMVAVEHMIRSTAKNPEDAIRAAETVSENFLLIAEHIKKGASSHEPTSNT